MMGIINLNLIYLTSRKKFKRFNYDVNKLLKEVGLTSQHAVYLMALEQNGNMKVKDINEYVENDGAITTRVLKILFSNTLIKKSEDNIRKCTISLTQKGKEVTEKVLIAIDKAREKNFKSLSREELIMLSKIAAKLS